MDGLPFFPMVSWLAVLLAKGFETVRVEDVAEEAEECASSIELQQV